MTKNLITLLQHTKSSPAQKHFKTTLDKHNLTSAEFIVLKSIIDLSANNTHISQMNICTYANIKPMNTSILLRKLTARKLVQRHEHPIDTRAKAISLTSAGQKTITEVLNNVDNTTSGH
ncbi:MAG: MarR family winged helix-turn-helix transcriptional regulator [Bacteroidia bacterium]